MDLLIILVIAIFIIAAVFVGYHASQEPHEEMIEGHSESIDVVVYRINFTSSIKSNLNELIL
jgi:hypothetical protein